MARIILDNVTVDFPVYDGTHRSIRHALLQFGVGGTISQRGRGFMEVRALDGINLDLRDGDRIGLIGHNGAGKSTLLRILAGIREPTSGHALIEGSTAALFSLGSILDIEMTGYENIDRAAVLLSIPGKWRSGIIEDVEGFTELGKFLNLPVKTYSAGMQLRLSFALMTAQDPEILLLDEVFGAGDAKFRIKAEQRMHALEKRTRILVFAHHSMVEIGRMCNKVAWLEHGRVHLFGPTDEVVAAYSAAREMEVIS